MGCLSWGVIGIVYLAALAWVNEQVAHAYGDGPAETALASIVGLTVIVLVVNSIRRSVQVRNTASQIIRDDRDYPDDMGRFGTWVDNGGYQGDEMTVSFAATRLLNAYGGPAVITLLIREGYQGIIEEDLLDVFDGERAARVLEAVFSATRKLPLSLQIGALLTGSIVGYQATRR